jgi:hypothetical protein
MKKLVIIGLVCWLIVPPLVVLWANGGITLYVGQDGCSDDGPGSADQPLCTFDEAVWRLEPGDTLVILPGVYRQRLVLGDVFGTPDAPITVCGASAESVIFDGGCAAFPCPLASAIWDADAWGLDGFVHISDSTHLVLRNITVRNVVAHGVYVWGGHHITISGVMVDGTGNGGLIVEQTADLTVTHNTIIHAQRGWIDLDGEPQIGAHEALSVIGVERFEVAHNTVRDTLKEGIDIKESASDGTVHHNTVARACMVGIYINEAFDVAVTENTVRDTGRLRLGDEAVLCELHPVFGADFSPWYGIGIQLATGDLGDLSQGKLARVDVIGNVVWNARQNGLEFWDEWSESGSGQGRMWDNRVLHNVFYGCGGSCLLVEYADNTIIANNIIAPLDGDTITGDAILASQITHNLFVDGSPVGAAALTGDPLFADPLAGDFSLLPDSPAIDAGIDVGLPYDGSAPDIGTIETG